MKTVQLTLPQEFETIEIHVFADEHIGDKFCDLERLRERIEYVKNTPNAFALLNGDIMDTATKTSIGDVETRTHNVMQGLEEAIDLFYPIKDKICGMTTGNHEMRLYKKEGIDYSKLLAMNLGVVDKYSDGAILVFLSFGKKGEGCPSGHPDRRRCYSVFALHGTCGGRKEGGKINQMIDMANIVDADVYIHSHTHTSASVKDNFLRVDRTNKSYVVAERLFVNNGANLDYGGYGEQMGYKPGSKTSPVIILNANWKKGAEARL